ncbi:MAG: hypothetical protein QOG69_2360 [Actinomycetota bacterium]|nr:hypothetical protein [Actinomycetota bacterium]
MRPRLLQRRSRTRVVELVDQLDVAGDTDGVGDATDVDDELAGAAGLDSAGWDATAALEAGGEEGSGGSVGRNGLPTTSAPCTGTNRPLTEPLLLNEIVTDTESPCCNGTVRSRRIALIRAVPGAPEVAAGTVVLLEGWMVPANGVPAAPEPLLAGAGDPAAPTGCAVTATT